MSISPATCLICLQTKEKHAKPNVENLVYVEDFVDNMICQKDSLVYQDRYHQYLLTVLNHHDHYHLGAIVQHDEQDFFDNTKRRIDMLDDVCHLI